MRIPWFAKKLCLQKPTFRGLSNLNRYVWKKESLDVEELQQGIHPGLQ